MPTMKATRVDQAAIHPDAVAHHGTEGKARDALQRAADVHVQMHKLGDAMRDNGATEAEVDRQVGLVIGTVESDIDFILNGQPF